MNVSTSTTARRTWIPRWLRWTAAIFVLLILLVIGGVMGINAQAQSAYQREIQALKAAGIPTTMAELEARRPAVADEVNSALLIESVADVLTS